LVVGVPDLSGKLARTPLLVRRNLGLVAVPLCRMAAASRQAGALGAARPAWRCRSPGGGGRRAGDEAPVDLQPRQHAVAEEPGGGGRASRPVGRGRTPRYDADTEGGRD